MAEITDKNIKQQVIDIYAALTSGMFVHVRYLLSNMNARDIAHLLESSPPKVRSMLWPLVDSEFHGDILEELSEEVRNGIIHLMVPEKVVAATENMDDDDLAEVLRNLPDRLYQEVINSMDHQDRHRAEQALAYQVDTAGSLMNTDFITIRSEVSVEVVLRYLRLKGELPEATDYLYVVSQNDLFIGGLAIATLLTCNPNHSVKEVMEYDVEAIRVVTPSNEVAQLFERHNWISAPVIDNNGYLLGRITIDDVVDIIREESEQSMMSMAGLDNDIDTFAPVMKSAQQRSIWLGVNLFTALLAMSVSALFESTLDELAILAVLNTVVPSMGGVAGGQTLTLVIRGLAVGHINSNNSQWLLWKEVGVGLVNGIVWAVIIASVVAVWKNDLLLGGVIAFAMLINLIAAGVSGVIIPILLRRFNIDPALAGGVILTTVTDIIGIFAFLGTATYFLL